MATRPLQIRDALVDALKSAAVAGVPRDHIHVNLRQAVASGQRPAIVLDLGDEPEPTRQYDQRQRRVDLTLRILADGADPFAVIDPIREAAHARVMQDKTLGGLCETLVEGPSQRERVDLDVPIGALLTVYQVSYTTRGEALS
jgi:hypothetical protein